MENDFEKRKPNDTVLLALGCALPVGIVLMLTLGPAESQQQLVRMYACLAATLLLALAAGRLWSAALQRNGRLKQIMGKTLPMTGVTAAAVCIALLCVWCLGLLPGAGVAEIIVYSVLMLILLAAIRKGSILQQRATWPVMIILGVILCLLAVLYVYTPNLLNSDGYVLHHYTAVTQTIYNAAFNIPYTVRSSGVYGHYAIFFWPFLKLFGHTPQVISILFSACSVLSMLLAFAAILKLTRSKGLLFLAAGVMADILISSQMYVAQWPLRILWPLLILVYLLYGPESGSRRSRGIYLVCGYLLCGLAITWNTDSGLVAAVAYTACIWLAGWQQERPFSRRMIKTYALTVLGCVLAVGVMLGVVNLYNLLCGGPLLLRGCFFPLIGSDGYTQYLQTSLLDAGISWLLPCCVLLAATAFGLFTTSLCKVSGSGQYRQAAFCGIMGLGQSYYFFNRSIAGWGCVRVYMFLCLLCMAAWAAQRPANGERRRIGPAARHMVGVCAQLWLCLYVVMCLLDFPAMWEDRIETERNSMASMKEMAAEIEEKVPENTYTFGYYTQELYAYLGWDPGYHLRDVSDLSYDSQLGQEVFADLEAQDALLVYAGNLNFLEDDRELLPENVIPETGVPMFYYYSRNVLPPTAAYFGVFDPDSLPIMRTRQEGFEYDEEQKCYWVSTRNTLVMNAQTLKEKGLEIELLAARYGLQNNGRDRAKITVFVEGKPVTGLELTKEDEKRSRSCVLTVAPGDLPDVPEDGLYDIKITLVAQKPIDWSGKICSLEYFGAPRSGKAVSATKTVVDG